MLSAIYIYYVELLYKEKEIFMFYKKKSFKNKDKMLYKGNLYK